MRSWIANACFGVAGTLGPIVGYTVIACVAVVIPLALIKRTRHIGGGFLLFGSYVLGAFLWFYSAGVTFTLWGWTGLIIGVFLMGIGVVPMAILAGFLKGFSSLAITTIVLIVLTFAARFTGAAFAASEET